MRAVWISPLITVTQYKYGLIKVARIGRYQDQILALGAVGSHLTNLPRFKAKP